ncbi:N-acetylmuramoyl-L-alanine amidase A [Folsomia candida]|uniref:N-acetylmuramoyl-L-alanine amidase n=1 Tax=Folsomia candida TaxID=158441 RepID=A0A226D5U7_FOLCA|nr:N-acetylmuramoyl-L-alanine amidase A [Folsomia candida]OXA40117.1 N-acetylmuramoyl-L-alanine amidase A [Folsomia candida]
MKLLLLLCLAVTFVYGQQDPGAIWIPSPHYNSRNGYSVKWLIVHGTAGGSSAVAIGEWFQNPASQASTHYVVGQDGTVVQCVNEGWAAWGNGVVEGGSDSWWGVNPNWVSISIEHVKSNTDNSNELTGPQAAASFNLIRNIIARNPGIRMAYANGDGGITGHFSMSPQSRARCPGPFPWEQMFNDLNGSGQPTCMGSATTALNIRAEPNTNSAIVGGVPMHNVVNVRAKVLGEDILGNPYWMQLHDGSGFIAAYYFNVHITQPGWCY